MADRPMRAIFGRSRRRIRVDKRYSAICTYRAAREHRLCRRQAYLCAVWRYGWEWQSEQAWRAVRNSVAAKRFLRLI